MLGTSPALIVVLQSYRNEKLLYCKGHQHLDKMVGYNMDKDSTTVTSDGVLVSKMYKELKKWHRELAESSPKMKHK